MYLQIIVTLRYILYPTPPRFPAESELQIYRTQFESVNTVKPLYTGHPWDSVKWLVSFPDPTHKRGGSGDCTVARYPLFRV